MARRYYSVALRFHSNDVSPDAITEKLGIEPTHVRRVGELRVPSGPDEPANQWATNMWSYQPDYDHSMALEEQLTSLLQELAPKKEAIRYLAREATAIFWYTCFSSFLATTTKLTPETLTEMASYGARLSLNHYVTDEDDDTD